MQYEKEVLIEVMFGDSSFAVLTRILNGEWEEYVLFGCFVVWKRKLKNED